MERPGDPHGARTDPEVSLGDAGIAAEIARAAARGRGPDRTPTLEQLLAAFGEREPTAAARRRVAAACRVAGMGVRPGVMEAEAGQRLLLLPPGAAVGRGRGRALIGLLAVAVVLIVAAGAAALVGGSGGDRASDSLPAAVSTASTATVTTAAPVPATTETAITGTTESVGTQGPDTPPTTTTADDEAAAARRERRRKARQRAKRRQQAAAAERHRDVEVVVDASARPTFLCVDDGHGRQLYGGTLSGRETFRAPEVRLNVGLSSTVVTVDGHQVPLPGSPAGLEISRSGGVQSLPLGQRPCA
ncbi:MAG TPA: hypothetical protein VFT50_15060 [Baekduia sp.]|nr:hypothetical protein [Baekduia sp.]